MNEVLTLLMQLLDEHKQSSWTSPQTHQALSQQLEKAGYPAEQIAATIQWLTGLSETQSDLAQSALQTHTSTRVYTQLEQLKLSKDCRGMLLSLERAGALNTLTRELIVDRLMALTTPSVSLTQVKWVVLLVLFSQQENETLKTCIEHLVLQENADWAHRTQ